MFLPMFLCLIAVNSLLAMEIDIPNPPPEQQDAEWVLIPDEDDHLHLVNVQSALNEPQPKFNVEIGVIFELYTRYNPHIAQILRPDDLVSLASSNFSPNRPTRFVSHGWNSKGDLTHSFSRAYFQQGDNDVNFIAINWQAGSNTINYISARNRVNLVGPHVARMVDYLVEFGGMNLEDVILVGHSLGAHVVGIAGKNVRSGLLPKIIGLDPANPLFNYRNPATRIAVGDAIAVETIHTNAGTLGFSAPLGDATFYPNGGRSQPGCGIDLAGSCAHSRAHEFYVESINTQTHFYSYPCQSYDEIRRGRCTVTGEQHRMGGDPGNQGTAHGVFFLETARQAPFALGRSS
ncbi:pancreatic lipase-related protein 2-like [Bradysia coprophila]|uniref:pancreatic lipase-related protein 2-like n=1 Tax=Bradysia coprophila TaxID=38358 RepID=UPI00187DD33A|nr:pancreatic lipase-related protein 2-like [Bradysia coprophila]XP_037028794.1 pancreatic lipase-related protein 2-like [Bradysia coprophila]